MSSQTSQKHIHSVLLAKKIWQRGSRLILPRLSFFGKKKTSFSSGKQLLFNGGRFLTRGGLGEIDWPPRGSQGHETNHPTAPKGRFFKSFYSVTPKSYFWGHRGLECGPPPRNYSWPLTRGRLGALNGKVLISSPTHARGVGITPAARNFQVFFVLPMAFCPDGPHLRLAPM